ncbi:hypothetical protein F4811DRAFT_573640 [Daldinia bambusicola]|nr:hypothetical protein F4811DRAFT_573640 [Daldinia bambusicola]
MAYSIRLTQVNNRPGLIFMAAFFCPMIITVVFCRFYGRRLVRTYFGIDDWLALTALLFVLTLNGIFIGGTVHSAITGHSPIEDNWPVTTELEHTAQKYKYAFQTTEKLTFGLIKLSILFLWKRIFGPTRYFVVFCWIMIGIISAWSLSFFFATVFQCGTQWTWNWAPIGIFLTQCTNTLNMLTVFTATDLLTDFIIMLMPAPIIWKLHMPTKKKIGVTSIFMVGLFTIGAGIARMYIYLVTSYDKEDNPDFIADFTLFILWSEIEANVAMVVCCMPTLTPALGKFSDSLATLWAKNQSDKWALPSSNVSASKLSAEPPLPLETMSLPAKGHSQNGIVPWQDAPRVVTEAGYNNIGEQSENNHGITTRTEIYRTLEYRPS